MTLTIKLPRSYIEELEQENDRLARRLVRAEKKIAELEQSLETSRRLFSQEKHQCERAQEAAELLTDQNTFLREALMRAMTNNKEAYREAVQKEEIHDHGTV